MSIHLSVVNVRGLIEQAIREECDDYITWSPLSSVEFSIGFDGLEYVVYLVGRSTGGPQSSSSTRYFRADDWASISSLRNLIRDDLAKIAEGLSPQPEDQPPHDEDEEGEGSDPSLGEIAYNAYGDARNWMVFDGKLMPTWQSQHQGLRDAWEAAAKAAVDAVH